MRLIAAAPLLVILTQLGAAPGGAETLPSTSELTESLSCAISGTAIVGGDNKKRDFTGAQKGYRLTFTDGAIKYKLDLIESYTVGSSATWERVQTRVATRPGDSANEEFQDSGVILHWVPFGAKQMTNVISNNLFRYVRSDPQNAIFIDMNPDPAKKSPDQSEVLGQPGPGVKEITTKLLAPDLRNPGLQFLAQSLACTYTATTARLPGNDFYAAAAGPVTKFRDQFNSTLTAEAAANACRPPAATDCAPLAEKAYQARKDRDALWQRLFQ